MNTPTTPTDIEDTISEALNLLHQFRDELVALIEGDKQPSCDKTLRHARGYGITIQCDSVSARLLSALKGLQTP